MRRLTLAVLTIGLLTLASAGSAVAQEAPEAEEIIIVDFETFDVDEDVMDNFYGHLRNIIAEEEAMNIGETGDITLDELLLMAGCDSPSPDCLVMVRDFVDGDSLLFGSVERSDDVHMFSLKLFDFESEEIVRDLTDKTLRGEDEWLDEGIPAVVEHLLYGETATVEVDVQGYESADVKLNGESVGVGSTTVDEVAPGEVVTVVTGPDGAEQQERFIVRHDERHTVEFEFDPAVADIDDPDDAPSLVPGLAVGGAGLAGLAVGVFGQTQLASASAEAETLVGDSSAISEEDVERAQQLDSDMTRANTMRWVGFGAGAAGLAGGGFLLFQALTSDAGAETASAAADDAIDIDVGISDDGVSAGFRLVF